MGFWGFGVLGFWGFGVLGGKCILYIVDGLYGGLKQDPDDLPLKFEMTPFNGFWTNSIFISQDPVALDSVIFDFLRNEPTVSTMIYDSEGDIYCVDNYLHEAALANDPPSQTIYKPNGVDQLHSLGVHEHWNNKIDKEYTRNLGTGEGIELLMVSAPGAHCDPVPGTPVNAPMGVARGTNPGRVVWKFDPSATTWDGNMNSWWWDQKNLHQGKVSNMLGESLVKLIEGGSMNSTNTISSTSTNTSSAWDEVFRSFNQRQGNTGGYMKGEKIGIKINLNGNRQNEDNNGNGISPQLVKSIIGELVNTVGAAEEDISVYDASRYINKNMIVPPQGVNEQFPGVHLIDRFGGEITEAVTVDNNSYLKFSSQDVLMQNSTKLPVVATGARYLISIAPFRGHPLAGFTATGKNWFGSIYRVVPNHVDGKYSCGIFGAWCPWTLHDYIVVRDNEMGTYNSLVDLLGHKDLGEKCIVYIIDGLYGGEMPAGDSPPIRWKSHPFDNHWSSSIFLSQDPVALDSVVFDFIRNEPNIKSMIYNEQGNIYCVDNYLHEAAMANDPPSKTIYSPDDRGVLGSLGTHEHWNNPKDKHYSRNIDSQKGKGIQLIQLLPERDSSLKGLSPGDICAIVIPTLICLLGLFGIAYYLYRKRKQRGVTGGLTGMSGPLQESDSTYV